MLFKKIPSCLLLFITTTIVCGQNLPPLDSLQVLIDSINKIADTKKNELTKDTLLLDSVLPVDIKGAHWDNTIYNPFKEISLKYPIELHFKDSTYASPIRNGKVVTSRYGWRRGRPHKGIDIDLVTGDSVFSMFDGIVRFARYNTGHGKTVIVRHYNGLETVYAHLSKYGVKENDSVKKGQYLGKGGATGNARGSHLHLVVNYKGVSIHPEYLFEFNTDNKIRSKDIWVTQKWTRPYLHNSRRKSKFELLTSEKEALASLEKKKKIYIVKAGDTLSRIARRNNTSITSICRTNYIKKNSLLKIGQKLVLEQ